MNTYTVGLEARGKPIASIAGATLESASEWLRNLKGEIYRNGYRIDCRILVNGKYGISRVSIADGLAWLGETEN